MTQNSTFYIKDGIVFSPKTRTYEIPPSIDDIQIPSETKNHLTNNKIIITDLEKISQKKGKELEISKPIENFKNIKEEMKNSNNRKTPEPDNYDFLEKTSAIQIVEGILASFSDNKERELKEKISAYIQKTSHIEKEKNASLDEQIQIEKNKLDKIKTEKANYEKNNTKTLKEKIEKSERLISDLQKERESLEKKIDNSNPKKPNENTQKIYERIEAMNHDAKNNELEIKILKAKMTSLKSEMRLGKKKCINWLFFILTLGLIYWTKYSDCKYYVLRYDQKINKLKEKNLILEKKKYNLQRELENASSKDNKSSITSAKEAEKTTLKIEELDIKMKNEQSSLAVLEKELKEKNKETSHLDKDINKAEEKIIELESIKEEFDKYSSAKINSKIDMIINNNKQKIKDIKELKTSLESQKIDIEGEWIIEI